MITGINHITWNVVDLEETFEFYTQILGLKPIMKSTKSAYFQAGTTWLAVVKGPKREDDRYDHLAFHVEEDDYDAMVDALLQHGVEQWQKNESEGNSFYFLDPSGNRFEIHSSDLAARIREGKKTWGDLVVWYD